MQRYKVRCHDCDPEIIPHEAGKWVRWGDVERLRTELAELRHFRKVIMDYDSNLYDALANSDAARKGEGE